MNHPAAAVTDGRDGSGAATYALVTATPAPPGDTVLSLVGTQRFVFGEIWNRPGLTRKERRLVTLILVAESGDLQSMNEHVYGALRSGDLTFDEMQEVVLHFAVYSGWPKATRFDESVVTQWRRLRAEDGLDPSALPVTRTPEGPFDASKRDACGVDAFVDVMTLDAPPPLTPYLENGVRGFVFGEMWNRPGISRKERRLVTLACVCAADAVTPIQSHIYAALNSGDVSLDEINEVALHCAVYCGWPKGSVFEVAVFEQWEKIQSQGGPIR
jgi:4-carboxymuconolactone decarboxylase